MKIHFKAMVIAAIAAIMGMTSCSKENENNKVDGIDNGETTNVSIMLSETSTRSVAEPAGAVAVNFKSGYILFTNGLGIITKVTEITETEPSATDKEAGTKVWLDHLKRENLGGEIKNVPASTDKVYIVGNIPTGVDVPVLAENITAVQNRIITIVSQSNDDGSVADVTLYGDGQTLSNHPSVEGAKYAKINVNAIAARIEIGKVSYFNAQGNNLLTSFSIDGIFVNYYYPQMSLASKVSTARINNTAVDNTEANTIYTPTATGAYKTADLKKLYDYDNDGLGYTSVSGLSKSAADPNDTDDKNVWAYNVLAPLTVDGTTVTELEAPHIIIRLSNIKTVGESIENPMYATTQYLTVKEFRHATTKEVITNFAPGYIYFINDLTFNESNLTDIPEEEAITVYVEAILMTWSRQEVEWGF